MPTGILNGTKKQKMQQVKNCSTSAEIHFLTKKSSHILKLWQEEINKMNQQVYEIVV